MTGKKAKKPVRTGSSRSFTKNTLIRPPATAHLPLGGRGLSIQQKRNLGTKAILLEAQRAKARVDLLCSGACYIYLNKCFGSLDYSLGYTPETIDMIRGYEGSTSGGDIDMQDVSGGDGDEDWVNEDMPIEEAFREAMQDVTHILRYACLRIMFRYSHCITGSIKGKKSGRKRTWKARLVQEQTAWDALIDPLTDAYLAWKYPAAVSSANTSPPLHAEHSAPMDSNPEPASLPYTVDAYDIFTTEVQVTVDRDPQSQSPALDLLRHGYLAKTPTRPTAAVAVRTLELLYRLRQRSPSFSIEAFAKVVLDYYAVSFYSRPLP